MTSITAAQTILHIASQYSTYAGFMTFTTGIIGNTINILVFTHLKFFRNNRCAFYLTVESISDFLYQLFSITITILMSMYGNDLTGTSLIWCKFKYLIGQLFGLITVSMVCFQAADQFFSTNYYLNARRICTLQFSRYLTLIIICIWLLHSTLFIFFVNIVPSLGCIISNQEWIRYATFFFYPILEGFLPIVIASSFSLLAFRNVRRIVRRQIPIQRRRFDRQITAMVLLRVAFLVLFSLPYTSYRVYTINANITQADPVRFAIGQLIRSVVISIVALVYTGNFYIFFISSSRYRHQVKYVLMKKCWRKWKNCFCFKKIEIHPDKAISSHSNNELK